MLKITYLKEGIYLESITESLEAWKNNRILVSLRAGISIHLESITACLILPLNHADFQDLVILQEQELVEITPCDREYVEVTLSGTWITTDHQSEEGVFVCAFESIKNEQLLYKIWQRSQTEISVLSE
ncbi:hypothetical protein NIES4102_27250 [Chondrocystis sp. NIES-4102]|nr:hypothetical protein NIES4102_27250 [Chondrocystis sp. NIES-4102]